MPIYEYKCADCGAHIEKMQKITDTPLKVCEACGGKLEKQWSLSGFQFKGAGWYVTDYSNKSKETTAEKPVSGGENDKKAEKTSPADSTAKTETASKETKDSAPVSKKETVSKKE